MEPIDDGTCNSSAQRSNVEPEICGLRFPASSENANATKE